MMKESLETLEMGRMTCRYMKKLKRDNVQCDSAVLERHSQSHEIIMLSFTSPRIHIIMPLFYMSIAIVSDSEFKSLLSTSTVVI